MNKLTKLDRVFVPVSVNDKLPNDIINEQKVFALENDSLFVATKIEDGYKLKDQKDYSHLEYEATHWLKEQNNKYLLSEDEIVKLISDTLSEGEYIGRNNKISAYESDYDDTTARKEKEQYIIQILNK